MILPAALVLPPHYPKLNVMYNNSLSLLNYMWKMCTVLKKQKNPKTPGAKGGQMKLKALERFSASCQALLSKVNSAWDPLSCMD
jgi:hypothetical protein